MDLGSKADPNLDDICFDTNLLKIGNRKIYYLLNKPVGYTCTRQDPHAEHTVLELIKDKKTYIYPVGRLDVDTSGLLLLTNDGVFTQILTHPSHEIDKTYLAVVEGEVTNDALDQLNNGVMLEDGITRPARTKLIGYNPEENLSTVEIIIHEGRKRQVRRMFEKVGHHLKDLTRTKLGHLNLRDVPVGEYRDLTSQEVKKLMNVARGRKK